MVSNEKNTYVFQGKDVDVAWDKRLCIHIAECGRAQGDLFIGGRKPWCQPDLVELTNVIDVVKRCPTGALTYTTKQEGHAETPAAENTLTVSYNGPYFLRGNIAIDGVAEDMPGVAYRAALCRCGKSKNKPFCDNSHEAANFRDSGAVGETGNDNPSKGGELNITPLMDGPMLLNGNLTIIASSGRVAWSGKSVALCRCGASQNKPFCDGSHTTIGFKSTE